MAGVFLTAIPRWSLFVRLENTAHTMTETRNLGLEQQQVACEVCLKEVPASEATVPEATDYVVYFCGLDCYQRWVKQRQAPGDGGECQPPVPAGTDSKPPR